MEEKRRFVRLDLNVDIKWSKQPGNINVKDSSKNISVVGICLMTDDRSLKVGDILNLEFKLPNKKSIKAVGRVVWVEKFEISSEDRGQKLDAGIEFIDISDEARRVIKDFVFMAYTKEEPVAES